MVFLVKESLELKTIKMDIDQNYLNRCQYQLRFNSRVINVARIICTLSRLCGEKSS